MATSPLLYLTLGLSALYLGERALEGLLGHGVAGCGVVLVLAACALATRRLGDTDPERQRAAARLLAAYAVVVLALALYAVPTYLLELSPRPRALVMVLWPGLMLFGLVPIAAMELALAGMAQAPKLELWRLTLAARAAVVGVLALVAFAGVNFAAAQWNRKLNLSYFKTTEPGEATLELVGTLAEPTTVIAFYPPGSEVLEDLRAYFEVLARKNDKLGFEINDAALEPELAKQYKVRSNGSLVFVRGERSETLSVGVDREDARDVLKKLDSEVQERLFKVVRPARIAYLTTGHGERDTSPPSSDQRYGLADFKALLESIGFTVKRLGLAEGLGKEVPSDATVVVIAGPTEPMLPAERAALAAYAGRGGRLWVLMEPDHGVIDQELLAALGVKMRERLTATNRMLVRLDEDKGESPYAFVTTRTSSHPSVKTLGQNSARMAAAFLGTGSLEKLEPAPAGLRVTFTLRTGAEAWVDDKPNGARDPDEPAKSLELMAAVEGDKTADGKDGLRALVTADADVVGNGVLRNQGNAYLALDGVKWLAGDEALAGKVESEEDVPLVHRKDEDAAWFYGTSFVIPAGVLAFGLFFTKRTRRRRGDA